MKSTVSISVLVNDISSRDDLVAEHGLSMWIETDEMCILFDTGKSDAFGSNARRLGISLAEADVVAISHGHYDHSGGLAHLPDAFEASRLCLHRGAVGPHYSRQDEPPHRAIGMPPESMLAVGRFGNRIVWTDGPTSLGKHVGLTGAIPRKTGFEDAGGPFFLDADCSVADPITDDQALWIRTKKGLVVVLGCAHAGVVNTLDHLATLHPDRRFHAVIGGMHLLQATEDRLRRTVDALNRLDVEIVAPCHCTGEAAIDFIEEHVAGEFMRPAAGSRLVM